MVALETKAGTEAEATVQMTAEDKEQFRAHFLNMASQIHTPELRSQVMISERQAMSLFRSPFFAAP